MVNWAPAVGLKSKIEAGIPSLGSWLSLGSVPVAEIMLQAGFEWLVIDLEHSSTTLREAENLIRVISLAGRVALVRVSANDSVQIKRVMDAGAHGVLVPGVVNEEGARQAVRSVRYPPSGARGVGLGRAQGYGPGFEAYKEGLAEAAIVVAQIEDVRGVDALESILGVPGIDATIIGPYDLSASLGVPGDFDSEIVRASVRKYEETSARLDCPTGFHVVHPSAELVQRKVRDGYTFLAFSADFLFLGEACRSELTKLTVPGT